MLRITKSLPIALALCCAFFPTIALAAESVPPMKLLRAPTEQVPGTVESSYVLGPGDEITILDHSSYGVDVQEPQPQTVTVLPDGTVTFYPIGTVLAAGKTLSQFNREVNELALRSTKYPSITVIVAIPRTVSIYVFGAVGAPGLVTASTPTPRPSFSAATSSKTGTTLPASSNDVGGPLRVSTAIKKAGGLRPDADVRHITLTNTLTSQSIQVDLLRLLVNHDVAVDFELHAGDVLFVPSMTPEGNQAAAALNSVMPAPEVGVWGAVKTPGLVEMRPGSTLLAAIAKAGGPTEYAADSITLSRSLPDGRMQKTTFSLKASLNGNDTTAAGPVLSGDVIVVGQSFKKKNGEKFLTATLTFVGALAILVIGRRIPQAQPRSVTNGTGNTVNPIF